ncbi:MAG: BBP7 family outer membrane beta-barrel protein [Planctomycetes bacterium]|nr:BBP7 family outer membrane beta-barrel protein [Planctomycetota bacterium]
MRRERAPVERAQVESLPADAVPGEPSSQTAPIQPAAAASYPQLTIAESQGFVTLDNPEVVVGSNGGAYTWASFDLLTSWVRGMHLPPLVTTSPVGTSLNTAGLFGLSTTQVLFGDNRVDGDSRFGVRFALGGWLNDERTVGFEAGYTIFETLQRNFGAASDGSTILDRPFISMADNLPNGLLIAFPGASSGSVAATATSSHFQSAFLDLRETFYSSPTIRLDSILGYRYLRFDERLSISDSFAPTNIPQFNVVPGTVIQNSDFFGATNEFNGGEVGVRAELLFGGWSLDFLGKVAVGGLHRVVTIAGQSRFNVPGATPTDFPAGLLALSSNSGRFGSSDWVTVPELGVNVNWHVSSRLKLRLGYSALLLTDVARPGDQIDLTINQALLPGGTGLGVARPAFNLIRTDAWIHTFNAGLVFTY